MDVSSRASGPGEISAVCQHRRTTPCSAAPHRAVPHRVMPHRAILTLMSFFNTVWEFALLDISISPVQLKASATDEEQQACTFVLWSLFKNTTFATVQNIHANLLTLTQPLRQAAGVRSPRAPRRYVTCQHASRRARHLHSCVLAREWQKGAVDKHLWNNLWIKCFKKKM